MASIAKAKCASAGLSICEAAIQLHGGLGMTNDYRIGQYYKRILVLNALHGSRDEHLDLLAKRRDASPDIRVS
jgi:alkylation response protein AidB-like acyl-CoA dehydrogenase